MSINKFVFYTNMFVWGTFIACLLANKFDVEFDTMIALMCWSVLAMCTYMLNTLCKNGDPAGTEEGV